METVINRCGEDLKRRRAKGRRGEGEKGEGEKERREKERRGKKQIKVIGGAKD